MKIGIITIHKSEVNYGASLQCYALWKYINNLGYDCEVIDLLRPCHSQYKRSRLFIEKGGKISLKRRLKAWLYDLMDNFGSKHDIDLIKQEKFRLFNKGITYSKTYCSVDDLYEASLSYNVYISGSDQVWNPRMPFINEPYFLTFTSADVRKVSYASSFGIDSLPIDIQAKYRKWLNRYDLISTREESGANIIKSLIGVKPRVVLDPVFLLSFEDWQKEMIKPEGLKQEQYVFLYMLNYDETLAEEAHKIAESRGLPVFMVLSENRIIYSRHAKQINEVGPKEWLWLLSHASIVVTSSFHGTAFSLIFNKVFVVFLKEGKSTNTRITNLLVPFGLSNHIYYLGKGRPKYDELLIRKKDVRGLYAATIKESCGFLTEAISTTK